MKELRELASMEMGGKKFYLVPAEMMPSTKGLKAESLLAELKKPAAEMIMPGMEAEVELGMETEAKEL